MFLNFVTERVAEALYAKFTLPPDEQKLDKNGKRLTINFAKARPCDEPQLERIADGARRTLRVDAVLSVDETVIRATLGNGRSEAILSCRRDEGAGERREMAEGEAAQSEGGASDAEPHSTGDANGGPRVQWIVSFSSVTAAVSAREVLNAQSDAPQQIGPATYIETPVLGDEELDELIAKAKDAEEAESRVAALALAEKDESAEMATATENGSVRPTGDGAPPHQPRLQSEEEQKQEVEELE